VNQKLHESKNFSKTPKEFDFIGINSATLQLQYAERWTNGHTATLTGTFLELLVATGQKNRRQLLDLPIKRLSQPTKTAPPHTDTHTHTTHTHTINTHTTHTPYTPHTYHTHLTHTPYTPHTYHTHTINTHTTYTLHTSHTPHTNTHHTHTPHHTQTQTHTHTHTLTPDVHLPSINETWEHNKSRLDK
jgi:hypothetical protein